MEFKYTFIEYATATAPLCPMTRRLSMAVLGQVRCRQDSPPGGVHAGDASSGGEVGGRQLRSSDDISDHDDDVSRA